MYVLGQTPSAGEETCGDTARARCLPAPGDNAGEVRPKAGEPLGLASRSDLLGVGDAAACGWCGASVTFLGGSSTPLEGVGGFANVAAMLGGGRFLTDSSCSVGDAAATCGASVKFLGGSSTPLEEVGGFANVAAMLGVGRINFNSFCIPFKNNLKRTPILLGFLSLENVLAALACIF